MTGIDCYAIPGKGSAEVMVFDAAGGGDRSETTVQRIVLTRNALRIFAERVLSAHFAVEHAAARGDSHADANT